MPRLPPVAMSRQTRLRARFWPGVIGSSTTFFQSHSSSSATSWARPVCVPCPISARATRITQVSSGLTTTHALISGSAALCAAAGAMPNGRLNPSANPPPAAAEPTRNLRRENFGAWPENVFLTLFMAASLNLDVGVVGGGANRPDRRGGIAAHMYDGAAAFGRTGRHVHGRPDALIGSAPADVGH